MASIRRLHKKQLKELRFQDRQNEITINDLKRFERKPIESRTVMNYDQTLSTILSEINKLNSKLPVFDNICKEESKMQEEYNEISRRAHESQYNYRKYKMNIYYEAFGKKEEYKNIMNYYKKAWVKNNKIKYEIEDEQMCFLDNENKTTYLERRLQDKQIEEIMVLDYKGLINFNSYDDMSAVTNESNCYHSRLKEEAPICSSYLEDNGLTRRSNINSVAEKYEIYYKDLEKTIDEEKLQNKTSHIEQKNTTNNSNLKETEEEIER